MTETYSVKQPRLLIIGRIINLIGCLVIFGIALTTWRDSFALIFSGIICFLVILEFPRYFFRLDFTLEEITIHRFPFPPKVITCAEITLVQRKQYLIGIDLRDEFGKRIPNISIANEGIEKFFDILRLRRPDLFSFQTDGSFKKKPKGALLIILSIWFIIGIISISLINLTGGLIFSIIYVFVSLIYIFWGVHEVSIQNDIITIKTIFSQRTFNSKEISAIILKGKLTNPLVKSIKLQLKDGKSVKINIEGHNMLIFYNQLHLWWETRISNQKG